MFRLFPRAAAPTLAAAWSWTTSGCEEGKDAPSRGGVWPACLRRGAGPGELDRGSLTNAAGLRLATYTIRAENPVGVAVLVHGYRECARFEWLAPEAPGGAHVK